MLPGICSFSVTVPEHSLWLIVAYIFATSAWRQYSLPYQDSVLSLAALFPDNGKLRQSETALLAYLDN